MSKIKRCVSLYSFQDAYATGRMTLDDIFGELVKMEVEGIEFITDQMMHNTPFPTKETLANWDRMMNKYNTLTPVVMDIFINSNLYSNRTLTKKERTAELLNEIELANRLGFKIVRMVCHTQADILREALPVAEKYGITLTFEIHGGLGFGTEITQEQYKVIRELGSPNLGFVVDASLFSRGLPRKVKIYSERMGMSPDVTAYMDNMYKTGRDPLTEFKNGYPQDLKDLFKSPVDSMAGMVGDMNENHPMSLLDEYMPYVKHFHGKIYGMTNGEADGFNTAEIINYLDSQGYEGYIATEYEGQRFKGIDEESDELETVRQHQQLLKKCIRT